MATKDKKGAKAPTKAEVEITLKNVDLVDYFFPSITHLGNLSIKNTDVIMKIVKAKRSAKTLKTDYFEARKLLLEQDCIKGKDGKPEMEVIDEEKGTMDYKYETPEIKMKAIQSVSDLNAQEVSFNVVPIKLAHLRNIEGVSANIIDSLDNFVEIE